MFIKAYANGSGARQSTGGRVARAARAVGSRIAGAARNAARGVANFFNRGRG